MSPTLKPPSDALLESLPPDAVRRLQLYADLLLRWQGTINLVAPSTLPDLWTRHIADSLQIQRAAPDALHWVDLGSGGGFPGLVTAILLADRPCASIHLVESDKRKVAFLRTVSRETGISAQIHATRIEAFVASHEARVDAVSARALASLDQLVVYAKKFLLNGAIGLFPKGQQVGAELTAVSGDPRFSFDVLPSRIQERSSLVLVKAASGIASHGGD